MTSYYSRLSTLLALVAAAPAAPKWFEPEMPPRPELRYLVFTPSDEAPRLDDANLDDTKAYCEQNGLDPGECIVPTEATQAAQEAWYRDRNRQVLFQWPWAYARGVIAAVPADLNLAAAD